MSGRWEHENTYCPFREIFGGANRGASNNKTTVVGPTWGIELAAFLPRFVVESRMDVFDLEQRTKQDSCMSLLNSLEYFFELHNRTAWSRA